MKIRKLRLPIFFSLVTYAVNDDGLVIVVAVDDIHLAR